MPRLLRLSALVALLVVAVVIPARGGDAWQQIRQLCGRATGITRGHGGVPEAVAAPQRFDRYSASLWAAPAVGVGQLWLVVVPRDGVPFVAPTDVHLELRAVADSSVVARYNAFPERVAHGARFVTRVALPREGRWHARVVIDGASGSDVLQASFMAPPAASPGLAGLTLYVVPFVLVAGLWGPGRLVRRRLSATRPASIPSP